MTWRTRVEHVLGPPLLDRVPRDHAESDRQVLRRRIVVAVTAIVGTVLLGLTLAVPPGDSSFYLFTGGVAMVWMVGGLLSGPLRLGYAPVRGGLRRPLLVPVAIGILAAAVFLVGALIVREIPPLRDYVERVLDHAGEGSIGLITVVTIANGVAEEVFFRGALYAAVGRRYPIVVSTLIYALATLATGNPMLVFAAVTLGFVLGLQRRASGGVLAPILTHVTWSVLMLFGLPPLFPH
jgi:membrane protease YdiL (CAAX protease family)